MPRGYQWQLFLSTETQRPLNTFPYSSPTLVEGGKDSLASGRREQEKRKNKQINRKVWPHPCAHRPSLGGEKLQIIWVWDEPRLDILLPEEMRFFVNMWEYPNSKRKGKWIHNPVGRASRGKRKFLSACTLPSPTQWSPAYSILSIFFYFGLSWCIKRVKNNLFFKKETKELCPLNFKVKIYDKVSQQAPGLTRRGGRWGVLFGLGKQVPARLCV